MAVQKILVRRLSGDTPHIATTGDMRRANAMMTLVALAILIPVFIVVVDDELGIRLVMVAFALSLAALVGFFHLMKRFPRDGVVYIASRGPGLHFRPPVWPTAVTVALIVLYGLVGVVAAIAVGLDGDGFVSPRRSPLLLTLLAVVFLGVVLWRLQVTPGLLLTVDGLQGIRARGDVDWPWDLLGEVTVTGPPATLSLTMVDGYVPVTCSMRYLGADPNQVAAIVRFFRDHPEERGVLETGGEAALNRAADVLRPVGG